MGQNMKKIEGYFRIEAFSDTVFIPYISAAISLKYEELPIHFKTP